MSNTTGRPVPPTMNHYSSTQGSFRKCIIGGSGTSPKEPIVSIATSASALNTSVHSQEARSDSEESRLPGSTVALTPTQEKQAKRDVERKEIEVMAARETRLLRAWRLVLMLAMLATGGMVTTGTFLYMRSQEENERLANYNIFTDTVSSASTSQLNAFTKAQLALAQSITIAGISDTNELQRNGETFPFVRVPMFEIHGGHTRHFSGVEVVAWCPLVLEAQRKDWADFVTLQQDWYDESLFLSRFDINDGTMGTKDDKEDHTGHDHRSLQTTTESGGLIHSFIWNGSNDTVSQQQSVVANVLPAPAGSVFAPVWQTSPPPFSKSVLNYNVLSESMMQAIVPALERIRKGLVTPTDPNLHNAFHHHGRHRILAGDEKTDGTEEHPHSSYIQPVFDGLDTSQSKLVGFVISTIAWEFFLSNLLPPEVTGMVAVLENTCDETFTFVLNGAHGHFLGRGDLHDSKYDDTRITIPVIATLDEDTVDIPGQCVYSYSLYFSDAFRAESSRNLAVICSVIIGTIFILMAGAFFMYDRFVNQRNTKIVGAAVTSNAFISTLFPSQIKTRLLMEEQDTDKDSAVQGQVSATGFHGTRSSDTSRLGDGDGDDVIISKSKPIADLFTETTILFADIVGFSAWSSVREPSQVFLFLETLFQSFDEIAAKREVFKVETVGDCYVAVVGLPEARKDHAVAMARFARECMLRMRTLSRKLEVTFGPDTGDLAMRMGIHSGPVTAGVLRGDRSRFQLFGDTMNTAGLMEQNGLRDRIHVSQETADLLIAAGKERWLSRRIELVYAKNKGELQTFWLDELPSRSSESSSQKDGSGTDENNVDSLLTAAISNTVLVATVASPNKMLEAKTQRLVKWSVDVLLRLLKQIVARRRVFPALVSERRPPNEGRFCTPTPMPVDEVVDNIPMPRFKANTKLPEDPDTITLDTAVVQQLRSFVNAIAGLYHDHEFHNFEHASHVAMSVVKLLSRIVEPPESDPMRSSRRDVSFTSSSSLHDQTNGLSSDPMTQLACVLAAMVHDVDHPGVPNVQLVQEQNELATRYRNQSMAEQHAVTVVWNLLMDKQYTLLRQTIYETDIELKRFRQVFVKASMATDLFDESLKETRGRSWERAFSSTAVTLTSSDALNRRASIVIECMLQASDVSHTMQHWHVYQKWNKRLFMECFSAYRAGRAKTNPADEWYERELSFFDFTVLPLARQLQELGDVFGVSSDEYYNYALRNRQEWAKRGRSVVDEMAQLAQKAHSI